MVTRDATPALFAAAPEALLGLEARYGEPHRRYHRWEHIQFMLDEFQEVRDHIHNPDAVLTAIYYHDAIYDPASRTNEEDSAVLFEEDAAGQLDLDEINLVNALIIATKGHDIAGQLNANEKSDCAYLLDIDMAILGAPADEYRQYARQIRDEYSIFPDALFFSGRLGILEGFLGKTAIFLTDHYRARLESSARANIASEIEMLRNLIGSQTS